ncbi:MAG: GNAT family N-acetyltransferase [Chitinophagales bacterium]
MRCTAVKTDFDNQFFFVVYASSRAEEMAAWGWSQEEQQKFLHMQYQCQQRSYQMQYSHLESSLITSDDQPAGRLITAKTEAGIVLVDISILPEFRNHGLGSSLILTLQSETPASESLRLSVLKSNPALRLYKRLGFQVHEENEMYFTMKWENPG